MKKTGQKKCNEWGKIGRKLYFLFYASVKYDKSAIYTMNIQISNQKICTTIFQDLSSKKIIEVCSFHLSDSLEFAKNLQSENRDSEIYVDCDEDSFLVLGNFFSKLSEILEVGKNSDLQIDSLIPFIAIDPDGVVLMQAFGNQMTLDLSFQNGFVHYFSRSRNKIWKKGEESGMVQPITKVFYLKKTEAVIFQTEKIPSCHTGFYSCYYRKLKENSLIQVYSKKEFDPDQIYKGK